MDTISKAKRSWNMSKIKSKNTGPELKVRKALTELGYRYRLHVDKLEGRPDIVLGKINTIILVNGCFWHQHYKCKYATVPKSNKEYWEKKLVRNVKRQREVIKILENQKWKVSIIWGCETKDMENLKNIITDRMSK